MNRIPGPYGHRLLVISRMIKPAGSNLPVLVQFASDDDALTYSLREFRIETALALVLLWVVLILASALQVRLGLRPLARVQTELARLRKNSSARLSSDHPREVAALVEAINALADARAADVERARHRAADLAHSLKTPLAALAGQSRRVRAEGADSAADAIDRTIAVARAALEAELTRARSALARDARGGCANVLDIVEQIVSVVEQTENGGSIAFEVEIEGTMAVPVAAPELAELMGALVENAARFAKRRVRVRAMLDGAASRIYVDDDGPGLGRDRINGALTRGTRLDEAGPGHGFGLAIVKELIDATGGTMEFAVAPIGGLEVCLSWPEDA